MSSPPATSASSRSAFQVAAELLEQDVGIHDAPSLLEVVGRLWIRTKRRQVEHLVPNAVQRDIAQRAFGIRGQRRLLVLKARQVGVSTFAQAWAYALVTSVQLTRAVTVSAEAAATERLVAMQRFFLSRDEREPATTVNRIREVSYQATEATSYIGTAGSRSFGRGDTVHFIHCSELAFWPDAETLLTGLQEALTPDGTIVIESTPNGMSGHFHKLWSEAPSNGYEPLFYPWWWEPEYRRPELAGELGQLSVDEQALIVQHNLDLAQIAWRRDAQARLREKFPQEYPENPVDCFLASGGTYFSLEGLRLQRGFVRPPLAEDQGLAIWEEPQPGHQYVVGADPSEGLKGGDFGVAQVIDVSSGRQVARLRGLWPTDEFARMVARLGLRYGTALLGVERNNHGHAVLNTLRNEAKYPNLYRHFEYDPLMSTDDRWRWGWPTTTTTKPVMLSELDQALRDAGLQVQDETTLGELHAMVWDGKGGVGAESGNHDDCAMALAIAWQMRKQPGGYAAAIGYLDHLIAESSPKESA